MKIIILFFVVNLSINLQAQSIGSGSPGLSDHNPVLLNKPIRFSPYKNNTFLFVDFNNYAMREVNEKGDVKTLFGDPEKKGFKDGNLDVVLFDGIHDVADDKLNKPADVIIVNGVLRVADLYNHQLKRQKL